MRHSILSRVPILIPLLFALLLSSLLMFVSMEATAVDASPAGGARPHVAAADIMAAMPSLGEATTWKTEPEGTWPVRSASDRGWRWQDDPPRPGWDEGQEEELPTWLTHRPPRPPAGAGAANPPPPAR